MPYEISPAEIKRRKLAYLSLSMSLVIGTFFSSIIYQVAIPIVGYALLSLALWLIGAFSFYFFRKMSVVKINLSGNSLQRKSGHSLEEYPFAKIKKIQIKWTSHNSIREIYIWMKNGKSIFVTGLLNFRKFRGELLSKVNKSAVINEWHEPINFDHLLFYPILGLIISNLSILACKNLINLNSHQAQLLMWLFLGYLFIFGLYFIFTTPIAKRSGNKTKGQDYILGILMITAGIFLWFIN
jgi:hypothetical protein